MLALIIIENLNLCLSQQTDTMPEFSYPLSTLGSDIIIHQAPMGIYVWELLAGVGCVYWGRGGRNSVSVCKRLLICHVREYGLDF